MDALEARVLGGLDVDGIIDLTEDLVRAAGENPGGHEGATAARLAAALRAVGADVELSEVQPGRPNLLARLGGADHSARGVLFLGHSDGTVDEEADATGVRHYVATTPRHRRYTACVVAEPTGLVTVTGCRGAANLRIDVVGASGTRAGRTTGRAR